MVINSSTADAAITCITREKQSNVFTPFLTQNIKVQCVYLCVGHIHPCGVEPVFDLLSVVDLQQVITPKLHLCQLLVVFKEIHWECHLTGSPGGLKYNHYIQISSPKF